MKTESEVVSYLSGIESRARAAGAIEEDEIHRGHAAIRALEPQLGQRATVARGREFGERMMRLKQELALQPTRDELDRIAQALASEKDPRKRERLAAEYARAARTLPQLYRTDAMRRLGDIRVHSAAAGP